jgi:hypothetical protein
MQGNYFLMDDSKEESKEEAKEG